MSLFALRGPLSSTSRIILEIAGVLFLVLIWGFLTMGENPIVASGILPSPGKVLSSYPELLTQNDLVLNIFRSLGLNLMGYLEAIAFALPIGFIIGLLPLFRGSFQRQVDAIRYIPLTAVTGLFIIWFGLGTSMKVHFLAFGIFIYLLPVVVQRIDEVKDVYLKTVYTIGATKWQTIRTVFFPSVVSRLSDDIRVLTAISWTYIIIAESLGNQGGIGALIWRTGQRQGRVDKVFAILIIIIIIGVIQDKLFSLLDREYFPFKYQTKKKYDQKKSSSLSMVYQFIGNLLFWILVVVYLFVAVIDPAFSIFSEGGVLAKSLQDAAWVFHLICLLIIGFGLYGKWQQGLFYKKSE